MTIVLNSNTKLLSQELKVDLDWQKENKKEAVSTWTKDAQKFISQEQEIDALLQNTQNYIQKGKFYSAITQLENILDLEPQSKTVLSLVYKRLGNAYSGIGKFEEAISNYQNSLKQEKFLSTLNNLVKTLNEESNYNNLIVKTTQPTNSSINNFNKFKIKAKQNKQLALNYAEQAISFSQDGTNKSSLSSAIALLNYFDLKQKLSFQQLERGREILDSLPASRKLGFVIINWSNIDQDRQLSWLEKAWTIAQETRDVYLQGYVSLELGSFYQKQGNLQLALEYAQKSQLNAQSEFAYDNFYRAQKLTGEIHQALNNSNDALVAYKNAIATLELLNQDSLSINTEQRINFGSQIEPIYREALKLLLNRPNLKKSDLIEAIAIADKLRIAQLQNYFGDDCFEISSQSIIN